MAFQIVYHTKVVKTDIPGLLHDVALRIKTDIEHKLTDRPHVFGKPLRQTLKGYSKLRVGDYRVFFRIEKDAVVVLAIGHRSVVYKHFNKRS